MTEERVLAVARIRIAAAACLSNIPPVRFEWFVRVSHWLEAVALPSKLCSDAFCVGPTVAPLHERLMAATTAMLHCRTILQLQVVQPQACHGLSLRSFTRTAEYGAARVFVGLLRESAAKLKSCRRRCRDERRSATIHSRSSKREMRLICCRKYRTSSTATSLVRNVLN